MNRLTQILTNIAARFLPDAYIFSLILTLIVFLLGITIQGESPLSMINYWGDGFWNLMKFSMQMTMILVCGYTLAQTPIINAGISKLASFPRSNISATVLVTIVSSIACFINWGFGLIVSALFALEVARQVKKVNFALLIAASYSGFLVWHGGLSGSIPLKLTNPSQKIKDIVGDQIFSLDQTLFTSMNMILLIGTTVIITFVNFIFSKDNSHLTQYFQIKDKEKIEIKKTNTPASKLEHSKMLNLAIVLLGLFYIGSQLFGGAKVTLNLIIFIFLILAILFSKTPISFLNNFSDSVKQSAGILIQFPFYAGIMGMMTKSGLATDFSQFFVSISSKEFFLVNTFFSAGIINFFVPSGGGQWAIQGPIILPAAKELGVDLTKASMAIAWGDAWTNMIQPFWTIPLLGIARLDLKDIMGYLFIIFLVSGAFSTLVFALLG